MQQQTALVLTAAITAAPAILAVFVNGRSSKARQDSIAATVTETAERGRHGREVAEKRAKAVATVLEDIRDQVVTLNGKTLGALADAIESRRVDDIAVTDRTAAESQHIAVVPVPPEGPGPVAAKRPAKRPPPRR